MIYRDYLKRIFDVLVVVSTSFIWLPLLIVIGLLIWISDARPILFMQPRPGMNSKVFRLLKFRTMTLDKDEFGVLRSDSERITSLGRFLRSTSLDELPSLINVLVGDMSLVGPRPLLVEYLNRYDSTQARRHDVRPGITGLAQVNGRNAISWSEKFEYDIVYVDTVSFPLDLKILYRTVWRVLVRQGISAEGHETMPEFKASTSDSSVKHD